MAVATLKIIPGSLPVGYCYPSSPDTFQNDILSRAQVNFESSSFTVIVSSPAQPPATDQDKIWFNTSDSRLYQYVGVWRSLHPEEAEGDVRRWYTSSLANLQLYDGGDTDTLGIVSGPMWEEDTTYQGRFPLHAGVLPTSGSSVSLGATGGADEVTLATENTPYHQHFGEAYYRSEQSSGGPSDPTGLGDGTEHERQGHTASSKENWNIAGVRTTTIEGDSGEAFDSLNPYKAGYWIKRTSRIYYKGS